MKRKFLPVVLVLAMVTVLALCAFVACDETETTQYTVTFRYSATNEKTVKVDEGGKVAAADIPAPTENFAWYIADANGNPTETAFTADTVVNADMLVVLKQVVFPTTQYTVTFRYSADNEQTVKVDEGGKVAAADIPAPTANHVWYVADANGDPTETAFTADYVVNSDVLVVLKEMNKYTVTFLYGEDNEETVTVYEGSKVAEEDIPAPTAGHVWYVADEDGDPTETKFTADTVVNGDMTVVLKEMLEGKVFNSRLVYSSFTWYWELAFDGHGNIAWKEWYQPSGGEFRVDSNGDGTYTFGTDEQYGTTVTITGVHNNINKTYYVISSDLLLLADYDAEGNDKNLGLKYLYSEEYETPDLSAFAGYWESEDHSEYVWFSYENGELTVVESSFTVYTVISSIDGKLIKLPEGSSSSSTTRVLTLTEEGISLQKGTSTPVLLTNKGNTRPFHGFEAGLVGNWSTSLGWNIEIEELKLKIDGQEIAVVDKTVSNAIRYVFSYNDAEYYIAKGEIDGEYFVFDASNHKQFLYSSSAPIDSDWYGNYTFTVDSTLYTIVVSDQGVTVNGTAASKVAFLEPVAYSGSRTKGGIYFYVTGIADPINGDVYLYRDSNTHKRENAYGIQFVTGGSSTDATKELDPIEEPADFTLDGIWYSSDSNYFFKFTKNEDGTITAVSDYSTTTIGTVAKLATSGRYTVKLSSTVCDITVNSNGTISIVASSDYSGTYTKDAKPDTTFAEELRKTWNTAGFDSNYESIGEVTIAEKTITFSVDGKEIEVYAIKEQTAGSRYIIMTTSFEKWTVWKSGGDWRLFNTPTTHSVYLVAQSSGGGDDTDPYESYYTQLKGEYYLNGTSWTNYIELKADKTVDFCGSATGTWKITGVENGVIKISITIEGNSDKTGEWTYTAGTLKSPDNKNYMA